MTRSQGPSETGGALEAWLLRLEPRLLRWIARHAGGLTAFEGPDDLYQGFVVRALESWPTCRGTTEPQVWRWLLTVARRFLADRADHWHAMRRDGGAVLRLTAGGTGSDPGLAAPLPASAATGPFTAAARGELLALAARAVAALPERDRRLLRWACEGVRLEEQAEHLGTSYAAAQRAGLRAVERFQKTFELVRRQPGRR